MIMTERRALLDTFFLQWETGVNLTSIVTPTNNSHPFFDIDLKEDSFKLFLFIFFLSLDGKKAEKKGGIVM